jgi:hypothetical protein
MSNASNDEEITYEYLSLPYRYYALQTFFQPISQPPAAASLPALVCLRDDNTEDLPELIFTDRIYSEARITPQSD